MVLADDGFLRPQVTIPREAELETSEASLFKQICPGIELHSPTPAGDSHPIFGRHVSVWAASATDAMIRHKGSSAGVLTALSTWLIETDRSTEVIGSRASRSEPTRTVPVTITTRDAALASAGSRYAPVGNVALYNPNDPYRSLVGKPCEVSAADRADNAFGVPEANRPIKLSFFCAGTPSQNATESLISNLGLGQANVTDLKYRGNGWPGEFIVESSNPPLRASLSYNESWGQHLGRDLQWRCKLCVDGTGADADISVGDFWDSDEQGYPIFAQGEGNSVAIARTARGHAILLQAANAGVIEVSPAQLSDVAQIQPLQVTRILTLRARLLGRRIAGFSVPKYRGYHLWRGALKKPVTGIRTMVGTWRRSRRSVHTATSSLTHQSSPQ
ncbi:Coenzyme F420 hydrogenase/dehydrogenase, beta subunit C-terminal domain [Georgenia sp. EYE_87]|uniref:Coenzyme F420 hydrogenase/dehydrogenase, beta subunit C-terminal domain n=1 Tax=Georgenia sp. EYE_87 TaxID=2853448 RepID=UPI00249ED7A6|nr:Coenzyme F420 hydrogenase/dehydrogenase, beta subunit C-terminal domain [Georgenia sp. EYE_87]